MPGVNATPLIANAVRTDFIGIDWSAPWLGPLVQAGQPVANQVIAGAPVHQALHSGARFVAADALPRGEAYEAFIARTGNVPTRNNLHDFFNGLIWQHYPLTKRRLNQLQAGALEEQGVGPVRGPLRDACTLFDESGAVLRAPESLWQALLARDWYGLFVTLRPLWQHATLTVFGHAVLEQLVHPHKGITAHVLILPCPVDLPPNAQAEKPAGTPDFSVAADPWLSASMPIDFMRTKPFTPLPLLGIPGWCPENETLAFYDDRAVFRPRRVAQSLKTGLEAASALVTPVLHFSRPIP